MKLKAQSGFTLIEIVMVLAILGILGAVALPKFVNLSSSANTTAASANVDALQAAYAASMAKAAAIDPLGPNGQGIYPSLSALSGAPQAATGGYQIEIGPGLDATGATKQEVCANTIPLLAQTGVTWPLTVYGIDFHGAGCMIAPVGWPQDQTYPTAYGFNYTQLASSPAAPGLLDKPLPLATDLSGICVGPGLLINTWQDNARTSPTTAASQLVAALDKTPVSNTTACPVAQ